MLRMTMLSGGVGGARLARALDRDDVDLTVVVNVGDDALTHGVYVSPDLDTVVYTLAGAEGPQGWGLADDSSRVMDTLAWLGADTTFAIGDRDLATNLYRTAALADDRPLSAITAEIASAYEVRPRVVPATDDPVRTKVHLDDGVVDFQEYFVRRRHADTVYDLSFDGATTSRPAPGVLDAITGADVVVIAPSNPPLSIWPILAVPGITDAVTGAERVIAVSPLFGGVALKGPAHDVMASLGLPPGNEGVVAAYDGLLSDLVVDAGDAADRNAIAGPELRVHVTDTRFADPERATTFGSWLCTVASS
jgi:LPPG:FO 2-phospho-L-lactate transferase